MAARTEAIAKLDHEIKKLEARLSVVNALLRGLTTPTLARKRLDIYRQLDALKWQREEIVHGS